MVSDYRPAGSSGGISKHQAESPVPSGIMAEQHQPRKASFMLHARSLVTDFYSCAEENGDNAYTPVLAVTLLHTLPSCDI